MFPAFFTDEPNVGKTFYLGKNGKYEGPISEDELRSMQNDGRLAAYTWIWDGAIRAWQPIEAPPLVPPGIEIGSEIDLIAQSFTDHIEDSQVATAEAEANDLTDLALGELEAILFDRNHFLRVKAIELSGKQFLLQTQQPGVFFARGSKISVMVYHTKTSESQLVMANVKAMKRVGRLSVFELQLDQKLSPWQEKTAA